MARTSLSVSARRCAVRAECECECGSDMVAASSSNMAVEETEDLTGVMWHDKNWLSFFPLSKDNVLEYFSHSQFYDERCNNQQIKLQMLDNKLLQSMAGIEYQVTADVPPALFVITKLLRSLSPPSLEPLAMYYVLDGDVYQAPSIHAVLSSRILQSMHHLRKAFETMQNASTVSGQGKHWWQPSPVSVNEREDVGDGQDATPLLSGAERSGVDGMLFEVLEKNRQIHGAHVDKMCAAQSDKGAEYDSGGRSATAIGSAQQRGAT